MSRRRPTADDLRRTAEVMEAIAEDRGLLTEVDADTKRRLLEAAGLVAHPTRDDDVRLKKALRRKDRRARQERDYALVMKTGMRTQGRAPVFIAPPAAAAPAATPAATSETGMNVHSAMPGGEELSEPRACYVCKAPFTRLHHFYDTLCPPCAALNWAKRNQTARLDGRVALITGARIKIGYQAALMMLRAGATVIATTRFPADAAARFAREADYETWSSRISVHGLDLRHAPSVQLFADWLARTLPRLDLLINNAAQTVRRPPAFYGALVAAEEQPLDDRARAILAGHHELIRSLGAPGEDPTIRAQEAVVTFSGAGEPVGLTRSSRLSQLTLAPGDDVRDPIVFPPGHVDPDDQQVDLRRVNSWRLRATEVATPELLEVHLVNAIAPFILTSRLEPLMSRERTGEKHVVNVSAMEAQFARNKKTDKHPHTNMAKAALNMLTRTSAADFATRGIWMNSVDTGWVTDEDPLHHVARKQRIHEFFPPLDVVDGAARVLDPIFTGLLTGEHPWGLFLKDYKPVAW